MTMVSRKAISFARVLNICKSFDEPGILIGLLAVSMGYSLMPTLALSVILPLLSMDKIFLAL